MPKLTIDLEARFAQAIDSFERLNRSATSSLNSIDRAVGNLKTSLGPLAAAFAALGVGASLKDTVKEMADLDDAAESTGASVESLSSLLNTLKPSGVGLEQITDAAGKLTRAMAGADEESSKAGDAFKALGVNTRDASGNLRAVDDVLVDVAKALNDYQDGTNKTAIAQAIFGKSGAALLPMLKDLATTQREAATVSAEQAAEAEELQKSIGKLSVAFDSLKTRIAGPLVTYLNNLIEQFRVGREAAGGFWNAVLRYGVGATPGASPEQEIQKRLKRLEEINAELEKSKNAVGGQTSAFGQFNARVNPNNGKDRSEELRREADQLSRDLVYWRAVAQQQGNNANLRSDALYGGEGVRPAAPKLPGSDKKPPKEQKEQISDGERYIQTLQGQIDKVQELTVEQEALAKIGRGEFKNLTTTEEQRILQLATRIDKIKEEQKAREELKKTIDDLAKSEEIEARTKAEALVPRELQIQLEAWKEYKRLVQGGAEAQRELKQAIIDRINAQVEAGKISRDEGDQFISTTLGAVKEEVKKTKSLAEELGLTFTSAFENAVAGGKKFSDVLKALAQDIVKLVLRKTFTEPVGQVLSNALSGGGSGGGGILAGVLGSLGLTRAEGGPVTAGTPYLVGERGPEMIVPKYSGVVIPNRALTTASKSTSNTYNVSVNFSGQSGSSEEVRRSGMQLGNEVVMQISRMRRSS